jgi:hypothetical protein
MAKVHTSLEAVAEEGFGEGSEGEGLVDRRHLDVGEEAVLGHL